MTAGSGCSGRCVVADGDIYDRFNDAIHEAADARAVLEIVGEWLDAFYGPVEDYDGGARGMTQLDHGHEEYEARMAMAAAVREYLGQ